MKSLNSYFSKIAILLIAIGSMAFLYWFGYHKNFDQECIPKNADGIAMVDVKNIRNYFVYSCIKNPSDCQLNSTDSEFRKRFGFSNYGIKIPDYLAFFHIENQPISQWFVTLKVDDETVFEKAINKANFHQTTLQNGMVAYFSYPLNLCIVKYSNQILVSNISKKQKQIAVKVAEDLFLKKLFLDVKKIEKTIGTQNAVTLWIKENILLEEDGILNLKLEENEITVDGLLHFKSKFQKEWQFTQNPNALFALGFDFKMIRNQKFITENSAKINKMIGFDLDSILAHKPTKTELLINEIVEKKDSAISYDYDDDFNPIKKVVLHISREPSFYFSIQTENSNKVYNYLKTQNAIDNHQVFVNFPFAQTKTSIQNNALTFEANSLKNLISQPSSSKIGYLKVRLNKLHPKDWRFIISKNKNFEFLKSFETLTIDLTTKNNSAFVQVRLRTKEERNLISVIK
jgi:tRNA splicing endonuclease